MMESPQPPFERFAHDADVGIRGFGRTWEEAFANGSLALFWVMWEVPKVEPEVEVSLETTGSDIESLFVAWLNALITLRDEQGLAFAGCTVASVSSSPSAPGAPLLWCATGTVRGAALHKVRAHLATEVKAATYSELSSGIGVPDQHHQPGRRPLPAAVGEGGYKYVQCIVDV